MRSHNKQFLALLFLLAIAILTGGHYLHQDWAQRTVMEQARRSGLEQLHTAVYVLQQLGASPAEEEVSQQLQELARRANVRFTLMNAQGEILADTALRARDVAGLASRGDRPEMVEAEETGLGTSVRYSTELHLEFLYMAMAVRDLAGMESGYLRLGQPYAPLRDRMEGFGFPFFLMGFGVLALSGAAAFLLGRRLKGEIFRISSSLDSLEQHGGSVRHGFLRELHPLVRSVNNASKRVQRYLQQGSQQREELETMLNSLEDAVAVLDSEGKVRRYNQAMTRISSAKKDLIGRRPIEFISSPELQDTVQQMLQQRRETGKSLLLTLHEDSYYEAMVLPMLYRWGGTQEVVLMLHDVTEIKRLDQVRRDFVANISHELRTPITSIKGYTEILLQSPPREEQTLQSFVRIIDRNVDNLSTLVDNLTRLSIAESAEGGSVQEEVDLVEAMETAWRVCEPLAHKKGVAADWSIPEQAVVTGNRDLLTRAIINLMDNAIKYSPDGERIGLEIQDLGSWWQVGVADNGPGVPPRLKPRIFERFFRGEGDKSKMSGTGLGLSIFKHIVHRHGGRIELESPISGKVKGSRFLFTLRKHAPHKQDSPEG